MNIHSCNEGYERVHLPIPRKRANAPLPPTNCHPPLPLTTVQTNKQLSSKKQYLDASAVSAIDFPPMTTEVINYEALLNIGSVAGASDMAMPCTQLEIELEDGYGNNPFTTRDDNRL